MVPSRDRWTPVSAACPPRVRDFSKKLCPCPRFQKDSCPRFQKIHARVRVRGFKKFHVRVRDLKISYVRVREFTYSHVRVREFTYRLTLTLIFN